MPTSIQSLCAVLTRRYPLYSGAIRFANHPWLRAIGGTQEELVWTKVQGGEVLCNLNELVGRTAYYVGDLDPKVSWICSQIVKPGDTVMDIGSNVGIVTLLLAKLVGPQGKVHAFEPNPKLLKLLNQTIQRNNASNVSLHSVALGATTGRLELRIMPDNTGSGSLILDYGQVDCEKTVVPVETLDSIMKKERIDSIQLIKIDVEGFETEVLRGGGRLLESVRPQAILFEFVDKSEGVLGDKPVFRILQDSGYGFFAIPKCRFRMQLEPLDLSRTNEEFTDFLAVQKNGNFDRIASAVRGRVS